MPRVAHQSLKRAVTNHALRVKVKKAAVMFVTIRSLKDHTENTRNQPNVSEERIKDTENQPKRSTERNHVDTKQASEDDQQFRVKYNLIKLNILL